MAIALDTSQGVASAAAATTLISASFAVAGNRLVAFMGSGTTTPSTPTALRWGGAGGTLLTQEGATVLSSPNANLKLSRFHLASPTAQSSTMHGTWPSADDERVIGTASFSGVDTLRTSPTPVTSAGNSPSITGTTVADDVMVAAVWGLDVTGESMNVTSAGGQTSLANCTFESGTPFVFEVFAMDYKLATGVSTTISWTFGGGVAMEDYIVMAFILIPSTVVGAAPGFTVPERVLRPRQFGPGLAR